MAVLEIDNNVVELGNSKLVFSKASYSFTDWLTKEIQYSERITLPETSLLNSIFKRPFSPDISAQKFSKFHTYKYKENGKIVSKGVAKFLRFNNNREYEFQLLDSSYELFENIKNNLNALDLESSDFTFNAASYNTLKVLNSSVWIWSASSMHEDKTLLNNILSGNLAFSRPYLSVKRLVESSFSANGWLYELGLNTDSFDQLIISPKSDFVFTSYEKSFTGIFTTSTLDLSSPTFLQGDTILPATQLNLANNSRLRFRGNAAADNDFTITITVSGVKPQVQTFIINKGDSNYDLTSNEFDGGDAVVISISGTGNLTFDNFLIYTIVGENDFGAMSLANFTNYKVKTYDNLPEIIQKELFKHCLVKIGGFFTTDNFKKKLTINSIVSLSKIGAVDWSEKFIEETADVYPLDGYAKLNQFEFTNSGTKPSNQGRGSFSIDNETLKDVTPIYTSIFEASPEVTITDTMIDNNIYNDIERVNDVDTLIGYHESVLTYTVARFESLNGNNIISNYYENFIAAIQKGEVFDVRMNLNKSDFFLFDFSKLVYISQKQSIFYVLAINNYSDNELTEVILLKA